MKLYDYQRSRSLIDLGPNLSDSIFLNFFSSITTRPIEGKFHVEPPWDKGTKVCSNNPSHMSKMAAVPICGKNPLNHSVFPVTLLSDFRRGSKLGLNAHIPLHFT